MNYTSGVQRILLPKAVICAGVFLLLCISWSTPALNQAFPVLFGVKFNSAFLLFLSGLSAWSWISGRSIWLTRLLAMGILALAVSSLIQDIFSVEFGIDELVVEDSLGRSQGLVHPGRLPGMTSITYLFFGLSLLLLTADSPRLLIGQFLLHGITLMTFIALTGYLVGVASFYTLAFLVGISPIVAVIWFFFSIGLTLVHPQVGITGLLLGKRKGSFLARRLTIRILISLLILTLIRIYAHQRGLVQEDFGDALFAVSFLITALFVIWEAAGWLNRSDMFRLQAEANLQKTNENLERLVEQRNEELKGILDSAAVSIIATDKNGLIKNFSKGAEQMLGYSADEVVGKVNPAIFHVEEEVERYSRILSEQTGLPILGEQVFTHLPNHGEVFAEEWSYRRKDGSQLPVQLNISTITSVAGANQGFIGIATDITQLTESRKNLRNFVEKIEAKNKQLLNFAHIISHNLRTPVHSLDALIGYFKAETDPQEKEELLGLIESVIKNLSVSMEETVDILRIQEDQGQTLEEVGLMAIVEKVKLALLGRIRETSAEISADFGQAPTLYFSKSYMESVFLNLLSNALKYRHPDRIPRISIKSEQRDGKFRLEFRDNGLGIDLEKHGEKVFGMNKTFHTHADAKGVGLYIVKTQLESLDGKISIESTVNVGTSFLIEFG